VNRPPLRLRVPATSANLGPGFDALALALSLSLEIEAEEGASFEIQASGRNAELCGTVEGNLILEVYREIWRRFGSGSAPALKLRVRNEIPLGMGCGSSAAARVAGVVLASHFGGLGWDRERIFEEAALLEGHPDNVAACVFGGFTVSGQGPGQDQNQDRNQTHNQNQNRNQNEDQARLIATTFAVPETWRLLLVLPERPLATTESRAVLPAMYTSEAAVANLQCVGLLTAGFAQGNEALVRAGMRDWLHQPYRAKVCELLPRLLPLGSEAGVLGVALSGAGPSVLVLLGGDREACIEAEVRRRIAGTVAEILPLRANASGLEAWSGGVQLW
jgi:homoserine kinase